MARWRKLGPYLLLSAIWALFFWRFAAPNLADRVAYPPGDFSQQFGVFRDLVYRGLSAGRLPLWADCLDSGYPLYADPQTQTFYLPNWLIFGALWAQGWGHYPLEALTAEVALHYLLVSWLLLAFLQSLRLRPWAALVGSVVFTYGGYLTGSPPLQTATLEVDTWLPLALLAVRRTAQRQRLSDLALAVAALALAYLAGHPQTFVYVAGLSLAYFVFQARQAGWPLRRLAGWGLALGGLTAGLAAIQLLPSLHFILGYSTRTRVDFAQAGAGFPFADVAQFLVTGLVSYWHPLYVGLLPLGLALLALGPRLSETRFWAGAALAGLLLSFGTKAVAYDALYLLVPGLRLFRGQEHFAVIVSFSLAVLAAFGAQRLLGPLSRRDRRAVARLGRAAAWLAGAAAGLMIALIYIAELGLAQGDAQRLIRGLGLVVFGAALAGAVIAVRARVPSLRRAVPALVLAVVVLDLFAANRPLNVVPAYTAFPYNPLLDAITSREGFFRVQDDSQLAGHAGCAYGYRAVESVTPYRLADYARFMASVPEHVRWQLLGVAYVVTWRAELLDGNGAPLGDQVVARGTIPDEKGNVTTVHALPGEPRRAFLAPRVVVASDAEALYGHLSNSDFSVDTAVVIGETIAASAGQAAGTLTVRRDEPGHVVLDVEAAEAALLVLSESDYPGWQVRIDGRPARLLAADGALLAVQVPRGMHQVAFRFQPPVLAWGAAVSAGTLLLLAGLVLGERRRHG